MTSIPQSPLYRPVYRELNPAPLTWPEKQRYGYLGPIGRPSPILYPRWVGGPLPLCRSGRRVLLKDYAILKALAPGSEALLTLWALDPPWPLVRCVGGEDFELVKWIEGKGPP